MIKFPKLRALMAEFGLNKTSLSKLIKKHPSSITYKLEGNGDFTLTEIQIITQFFRKRDPAITSDFIFCTDGNYNYQNNES